MADITQITAIRTVRIVNHKRTVSVIPHTQHRIFLWQRIQRIRSVVARIRRIAGKTSVVISQQVIHIAGYTAPIIQVQQEAEIIYFHLVSRMFRMQRKNLLLTLIMNRHNYSCLPAPRTFFTFTIILPHHSQHRSKSVSGRSDRTPESESATAGKTQMPGYSSFQTVTGNLTVQAAACSGKNLP